MQKWFILDFKFVKQYIESPPLPPALPPIHLIRTPIKIILDWSVSVTLVSFFQKKMLTEGLLPFKTYFFKTYLTLLKLLEAKAFNARLEASLIWLGYSWEILVETIK